MILIKNVLVSLRNALNFDKWSVFFLSLEHAQDLHGRHEPQGG